MSSTRSLSVSFPEINIPDSQKNQDFHKKMVEAITNYSRNQSFDLDYAAMDECYKFYDSTQSGDEFNFLQTSEDGDTLPAKWINLPNIRHKMNILTGEFMRLGYQLNVRTINKDAVIRKLEQKDNIRTQMRMKPVTEGLEEQFRLPLSDPNQQLPRSDQDLDEFMKYNYREKSEIVMERALNYALKQGRTWDYERMSLFRDLLITNRAWAKIEVKNGIPVVRRIDPRYMIFDRNCTDDFASDSTYFGEIRYMGLSEVAEAYNLKREQLKEAYDSFSKHTTTHISTVTSLQPFINESDGIRVLVVSAVWRDYKKMSFKNSTDNYGFTHLKKVTPSNIESDAVENHQVEIWRKGTLIADKFFKDWGEIKNQVRSIDNLSSTTSPYFVLLPDYVNKQSISVVGLLRGLQNLKNITMYNLQVSMSRAGAKGFVFDTSQLPEHWNVEKMLKYLKTVGIAFINSKKDGVPAQFNQFQQFDMSLSESVKQYLAILGSLDNEMDRVSGVNQAREGQMVGAQQTVGVTRSSLIQSNMSTETKFKEFNMFASRVLNYVAGLIKLNWPMAKERFAPILGESGINFLETDIELDLNDYGVFIEEIPPVINDYQNFQALVQAAIQAGQLSFLAGIKLLKEPDINVGIRLFERELEKQEERTIQQAESQFTQQQQAQQSQQQAIQESEAQKTQAELTTKLTLEDFKQKAQMNKTLAEIRGRLSEKKIDFKKDFEIAKIKERNKKRLT
jgi:hypothetical protein